MKRSDVEEFNAEMERLIAAGEKALSIIYADREDVKDSILLDSIMEAQCFLSVGARRQRMGSIAFDYMVNEAMQSLPEDAPEAIMAEETERAVVEAAMALPRLEQRIRDGLGDDPCAYFNSIRLKYPYKRERKRPPRRSDRPEP